MSCRSPSLTFLLLLLLLRVQSIDLTRTRFLSAESDLEFPEIDGSAVDDTCRVFPVPTPSPSPTRITTTTAKPPPVTRKQVVVTTKKPEVQIAPRKPETKHRGAPVRPQPAPAGPIRNNHPNPAARLLHLLLTNSRGRAAASLPGFIRRASDSDELAAVLPRRTVRNRWNVGLFSSSDSSDES